MTRQIKFRVWEKYDESYAKEMEKSGEMHYSEAWGKNDDLQEKRAVVISGFYHDSGWDMQDFTPMQFTGFIAAGKEVYEGDILENDSEWFRVEWNNDQLCWTAADLLEGEDIALCELGSSMTFVQGNIYESQHLLDQLAKPDTEL